jgi:hypothetical protein
MRTALRRHGRRIAAMSRSDRPADTRREQSRQAHDTRQTHQNRQDFDRREVQRGTQRSELQTEGGRRHDDGGSYRPDPGRYEQEQGDDRRPYKRAGR